MQQKQKKYIITLSSGETRTIYILINPVYLCSCTWQGNDTFATAKEIEERPDVYKKIEEEPFRLSQKYVGYLRGETEMFNVYKGLRTPIIKLELVEED